MLRWAKKTTKSKHARTFWNLRYIDHVLPCQSDVERVWSKLWACFWRISSVDCNAHWHIVKSQDISLTCLGRVPSVDWAYWRAYGEPWACSKCVRDMSQALLLSPVCIKGMQHTCCLLFVFCGPSRSQCLIVKLEFNSQTDKCQIFNTSTHDIVSEELLSYSGIWNVRVRFWYAIGTLQVHCIR